ncbi:uncharacterized protein LOC135843634 [Planococcus citri]|uniref:uncharacterized protein LOC135843634 n=1 Tax=Planococcus citri TaxID=170843 RepID=UPI0031F742AF
MNFLIILSILVLIEETVSKDVFINANLPISPLALIRKPDSLLWKPATPFRSPHNDNEVGYSYSDVEDEHGLKDEFKIACAASSDRVKAIENKWKEEQSSSKLPEEKKLFFMQEFPEYEELSVVCREPAKPSIREIYSESCGKSTGDALYEVGYPVSKDNVGRGVQFMSVYKVCRSVNEDVGTLYTIHQIVSPDLMMLQYKQWYEPEPSKAFKSNLDGCVGCLGTFYKENKLYVYQFVSMFDMPTKILQLTTHFPFNFIPVKDNEIFMGLLRVDQFIRLFSRKTNQPLRLYSGRYQKTVNIRPSGLCKALGCSKNLPIELLWKIVNNGSHSIMLITQLTQQSCTQTKNILCKDDNTLVMLETYKNGGCTYKCPVTSTIISEFGLPSLEFLGVYEDLLLDFKVSEEQLNYLRKLTGGPSNANTSSIVSHEVGIADFMGNVNKFEAAVRAVDAQPEQNVQNGHNGDEQGLEIIREDDPSNRTEDDLSKGAEYDLSKEAEYDLSNGAEAEDNATGR